MGPDLHRRSCTAAKRLRHELGLCGYAHVQKKTERRTYFIDDHEKQRFLGWCDQNVRAVWQEIHTPVDLAKQKLREDERAMIREFKPLLNVKDSDNPFKPCIKEARKRFRAAVLNG